MGRLLDAFIIGPLRRFFTNTFSAVSEINRKYAAPHIKTSMAVKFSLVCLRLYLILLIALLFFKFYSMLKQ